MKTILLLIAGLIVSAAPAQDLKDSASDKAALIEGQLRDTKPSAEITTSDGTKIAIWTVSQKDGPDASVRQIAKASARKETALEKEGIRKTTVQFAYDNGVLQTANYAETVIIQNPTPSVTSKKKDFLYTNGELSSPAKGAFPEMEALLDSCLSAIQKTLSSHVNKP